MSFLEDQDSVNCRTNSEVEEWDSQILKYIPSIFDLHICLHIHLLILLKFIHQLE